MSLQHPGPYNNTLQWTIQLQCSAYVQSGMCRLWCYIDYRVVTRQPTESFGTRKNWRDPWWNIPDAAMCTPPQPFHCRSLLQNYNIGPFRLLSGQTDRINDKEIISDNMMMFCSGIQQQTRPRLVTSDDIFDLILNTHVGMLAAFLLSESAGSKLKQPRREWLLQWKQPNSSLQRMRRPS